MHLAFTFTISLALLTFAFESHAMLSFTFLLFLALAFTFPLQLELSIPLLSLSLSFSFSLALSDAFELHLTFSFFTLLGEQTLPFQLLLLLTFSLCFQLTQLSLSLLQLQFTLMLTLQILVVLTLVFFVFVIDMVTMVVMTVTMRMRMRRRRWWRGRFVLRGGWYDGLDAQAGAPTVGCHHNGRRRGGGTTTVSLRARRRRESEWRTCTFALSLSSVSLPLDSVDVPPRIHPDRYPRLHLRLMLLLLLLLRGGRGSSQLSLLFLDGCPSARSTSDPASLSLLFLHPFLHLRLLPASCRRSNVFALQQRVDRGVLVFYFGNGPVEVHRETPLGDGAQEGARIGRGDRERQVRVDRGGIRFQFNDAIHKLTEWKPDSGVERREREREKEKQGTYARSMRHLRFLSPEVRSSMIVSRCFCARHHGRCARPR